GDGRGNQASGRAPETPNTDPLRYPGDGLRVPFALERDHRRIHGFAARARAFARVFRSYPRGRRRLAEGSFRPPTTSIAGSPTDRGDGRIVKGTGNPQATPDVKPLSDRGERCRARLVAGGPSRLLHP